MSGSVAERVVETPELTDLVGKIWHQVIGQVNRLIQAHDRFGFVRFEEGLNPSLPDVVKALELVDFALTQFYGSGLLEYDEQRNVLNAKQCILKIKMLAVAIDRRDQDVFEQLMEELRNQSKF